MQPRITRNVKRNRKKAKLIILRSIIKPKKMRHGFTASDCGCALVTDKGNVYLGVGIDISSSMGFCAEHSAIAAKEFS